MKKQLYKGRDMRSKGWFWLDNDYLNGYAKILGPIGTAVYISLCRHADQTNQKCFPAMETIAEENGIKSRNTVSKYLKELEKYNIIEITEEYDKETKKRLNNVYELLDKIYWKPKPCTRDEHGSHAQLVTKPCTSDEQSHAQEMSSKETHNKETHNKETSKVNLAGKKFSQLGADVIKQFETIDPKNKKYYNNTTQREASDFLIEEYSFEMVSKIILFLPKTNVMEYMPTITTPVQLRDKWIQLESALLREKQKKKKAPEVLISSHFQKS